MTLPKITSKGSHYKVMALAATACLGLAACAGSVGEEDGDDAGEGVPAGAEFEEYQNALEDMPETTLTFQPVASSPDDISALRALEFKEKVEEASGGKITIDIVWGQAIAGYSDIDDALIDGRVDIAATLPSHSPSEYPVTNAFVAGSSLAGSSPRLGDLATNAAMLEVAWNSEELIEEFESKDLNVLMPFHADGNQLAMCSQPINSESDWAGRQIRVASAIASQQVDALGASSVTLEFPEVYEAIQRGAIDCAQSHGTVAVGVGFIDVSPHYSYSEDVGFARTPVSIVAGSSYEALPLAAQQLIFDQMETVFMAQRMTTLQGNAELAKSARDNNGSFSRLDDASEDKLREVSESLINDNIEQGIVPEGFDTEIEETLDKWNGIVEEMGLGDEGEFETFDQWHDFDEVDLEPFVNRVYEDIMQEHRPG